MEKVNEVMTQDVRSLSPGDSLQLAAQLMQTLDVGSVPVCDGRQLVGMVTDRDITVRGVALGLSMESTALEEIMTGEVQSCFEDQSIEEAARLMCETQVRRLPVVDHDKRLVGMLALGDVAIKTDPAAAERALRGISSPTEFDRGRTASESGGSNNTH